MTISCSLSYRTALLLFALSIVRTSSAQDVPKNVATTVQLPTFGVSIDADGELTVKSFRDPTGELAARRVVAARERLGKDIAASSPLRKISLATLERVIQERLEAGLPLDDCALRLPPANS